MATSRTPITRRLPDHVERCAAATIAPGPDGMGLLGMGERAELLGGEFEVTTSLGSGTVVSARLPT